MLYITILNSNLSKWNMNINPEGSTMEEKISNSNFSSVYIWADYNSSSYSPTGENKLWFYLLFMGVSNNYITCFAHNCGDAESYLYYGSSKRWKKITSTNVN